ncbi:MAG: cytochrome C551 [Nitrospinae bacterium CG11_big_fil_rev_8_21_14_0_20_45_15]|nr:MAG: cytochrome C551 [Nitrospinae bacterium CG11_big_fil_rev_8_21_14_0_20_45_15]
MTDQIGPEELTGEEEILVCTCMQSRHWPYCDASHHTLGGGKEPVVVSLDKNKTYKICKCFKTKNRPFCDDSHIK